MALRRIYKNPGIVDNPVEWSLHLCLSFNLTNNAFLILCFLYLKCANCCKYRPLLHLVNVVAVGSARAGPCPQQPHASWGHSELWILSSHNQTPVSTSTREYQISFWRTDSYSDINWRKLDLAWFSIDTQSCPSCMIFVDMRPNSTPRILTMF